MNDYEDEEKSSNAWYSYSGPENDVILSTRVRLARNLASFPFPKKFKDDDAERIRSLVFDSFAHCENPDRYTGVAADELDTVGAQILDERGIFEKAASRINGTGIIIRTDGKISCAINDIDHVRIASFVPGLDCEKAFTLCREVDDELQNTLQFAASYDLGFLNSSLVDTGSGMKASCRMHLPCLSFSGKLKDMLSAASEKRISVRDSFGIGNIQGSSLGFYYQVSSMNSGTGNEVDQLANVVSFVKYLAENERREREFVLRNRQTELRDRIYRAYAKVKFASLMNMREAIEVVSDIKWGKNLGFYSDVSDTDLCALLYRIQDGHLKFVLRDKRFNFPKDIEENTELKIENLRALILQEAFEKLKVN